MKLKVLNREGKETSKTANFDKKVFGAEPNDHAVYLDVKQHLANKRQGTHKTQDRSDMSYSTIKLRKQKGSGAARVGRRNSGILKGGANIHGPKPRDYSFKLNKKLKRIARRSAITYKLNDKKVLVVENFDFEKPSTKDFINFLANLKIEDSRILLLTNGVKMNTVLSGRNISGVKTMNALDVNTYEVMKAKQIILLDDCIEELTNILR